MYAILIVNNNLQTNRRSKSGIPDNLSSHGIIYGSPNSSLLNTKTALVLLSSKRTDTPLIANSSRPLDQFWARANRKITLRSVTLVGRKGLYRLRPVPAPKSELPDSGPLVRFRVPESPSH